MGQTEEGFSAGGRGSGSAAARRWLLTTALTGVLVAFLAGALVLSSAEPAGANPVRVKLRLLTTSQHEIRKSKRLMVRVRATKPTRVRFGAQAREGKKHPGLKKGLARPRKVHLRHQGRRVVRLRLTRRGRRVLGSCSLRRVIARGVYRRPAGGGHHPRKVVARAKRTLRPDLQGRHCLQGGVGTPAFSLPPWSDGLWTDPSHYETIQTADLDGDGNPELFARASWGVDAWTFDDDLGQWRPLPPLRGPLTDAGGWDEPPYYRTFQAADLDGDGADEIFVRGAAGLLAWKYEPETQSWRELADAFGPSDANDWYQPQYYLTIQAADIDGDGSDEVIGRSAGGLVAWKYDGDSDSWQFLSNPNGPHAFSDANGYDQPEFYRTIQAADLDGDGKDEIFGRDASGIIAWDYQPSTESWEEPIPLLQGSTAPSDANGWGPPEYYRTIAPADLDGDGADEIFAREADGLVAWKYVPNSDSWETLPKFTGGGAPSDNNGWISPSQYLTIHAADLNGDGRDEVYGRGAGGITPWELGNSGWTALPTEDDFSDAAGWSQDGYYYRTIQAADVDGDHRAELLGRFLTGMVTVTFDPAANQWSGLSADFPSFAGGDQAAAYAAINAAIGQGQGPVEYCTGSGNSGFDLRAAYAQASSGQLENWQACVQHMQQPPGVSAQAWSAVQDEVLHELTNAAAVANWYEGYLHDRADDLYIAESMDTSAQTLEFDVQSQQDLDLQEWNLFGSILDGLEVADALPDEAGEASVVLSSLIAGGTSAGLTVDGVGNAVDGIKGTYQAIRQQLQDDFENAVDGLAEAESEINSDYGLQSEVGGLINSGAWTKLSGDDLAISEAAAERAYSISVWQAITPGIWMAYRFPPDHAGDYCDPSCDWEDSAGNWWQLNYNREVSGSNCNSAAYKYGPCGPVDARLRNQLFADMSDACEQTWDETKCGFGVSPQDVFGGQNGWQNLPAWTCGDGEIFVSELSCKQVR